jgi:hypothetical protein
MLSELEMSLDPLANYGLAGRIQGALNTRLHKLQPRLYLRIEIARFSTHASQSSVHRGASSGVYCDVAGAHCTQFCVVQLSGIGLTSMS